MYSPVHATAGLLIARAIPHPVVGLAAAVASHYFLDAVPHGDSGFGQWLTGPGAGRRIFVTEAFDLGSAALMVWWLVATHPDRAAWYLIAGAMAGILPDVLWGLRFIIDRPGWRVPILLPLLLWHDRLHSWGHAKANYDLPLWAGLTYQGGILAAVLLGRL